MAAAQVRAACGAPDRTRTESADRLPVAAERRQLELWSYDDGAAVLIFGDGELIAIRRH